MSPRQYRLGKRAETVEQTRERIIAATRELLGLEGYPHASVDEVARLADVPRATVYCQFGSKRGLIEAVVPDIRQRAGQGGVVDSVESPTPSRRYARPSSWLAILGGRAPARPQAHRARGGRGGRPPTPPRPTVTGATSSAIYEPAPTLAPPSSTQPRPGSFFVSPEGCWTPRTPCRAAHLRHHLHPRLERSRAGRADRGEPELPQTSQRVLQAPGLGDADALEAEEVDLGDVGEPATGGRMTLPGAGVGARA
jgi:hypothetical protein